MASGSYYDGMVSVWDAVSGQETLTIKGHTGPVMSVAFSPDGKRLTSASQDRTVKVWDAVSGAELLTLNGLSEMCDQVVLSPDGKRLASMSQSGTVTVWDATNGLEVFTLRDGGFLHESYCVAFSPHGKWLATGLRGPNLGGPPLVMLWDASSGQLIRRLKGQDFVHCVAFSPDEKWLASGSSDRTVKVWDTTSGLEVRTLRGHTGPLGCVAFSPDGKRLASASASDGTVRMWDLTNGKEEFRLPADARTLVFSPDSKRLVSTGFNGEVKVWDATNGLEPLTLQGSDCFAFSADGTRLATVEDMAVKVLDATSYLFSPTLTLKRHSETVEIEGRPNNGITSVTWSADGKRLASASRDGIVKVWDGKTGEETLNVKGHTGPVNCVALSPDGKRLASASGDTGYAPVVPGELKVWDATNGQEVYALKEHTASVNWVTFSSDGKRMASASGDRRQREPGPGEIKVWDTTSGQVLFTIKEAHGGFECVAFRPDGKQLATSRCQSPTVDLWDVTSGEHQLSLIGHTNPAVCVAFSPDGKRLASTTAWGAVKLWDTTNGQVMLSLQIKDLRPDRRVAFSPDGHWLVLTGENHRLKLLDARPWTPEFRAEQVALELLRGRCAEGLEKQDLLNTLATDQTISESVRQHAMKLADTYWERDLINWITQFVDEHYRQGLLQEEVIQAIADDKTISETMRKRALELARNRTEDLYGGLRNRYWEVVLKPDQPIQQYRLALRLAETAQRIASNGDHFFSDIGIAQYRLGQYDEALKTLSHAVESSSNAEGINGDATTLGFLAMAHHRLGHTETAQQFLTHIRLIHEGSDHKNYSNADSAENVSLQEAERLIDPENITRTKWTVSFFDWEDAGPMKPPSDWQRVIRGPPLDTQQVEQINFHWNAAAPSNKVPADHFATVATMDIALPAADYYQISTLSDDGIRVYIDDKLILENWKWHQPTEDVEFAELSAGKHQIRIEHFEIDGNARLQFRIRYENASVLSQWLLQRALEKLNKGEHAHAVKAADKLRKRNPNHNGRLYDAACVYALSAESVIKDKPTPTDAEQAEQQKYLKLAIDCLKESCARGWDNFAHMREDEDLKALRGLPEFEALFPK